MTAEGAESWSSEVNTTSDHVPLELGARHSYYDKLVQALTSASPSCNATLQDVGQFHVKYSYCTRTLAQRTVYCYCAAPLFTNVHVRPFADSLIASLLSWPVSVRQTTRSPSRCPKMRSAFEREILEIHE